MASLSLLKNWLDDALLPYLRQDLALAAETLESFVAVWPEDVLARSALVGCWLNLLELASEDEEPALRDKLHEQRDFILAPDAPAEWLSVWNRARFLHLCRALPAVEAPRSQLALYAALRDVDVALAFSPFDFHAQATKARVLRALERDADAFRIAWTLEWLMPRFTGLEMLRADPAYLQWRTADVRPVEPFDHEPSLPPAVSAVLQPEAGDDAWTRARDAALAALALELHRSPAELTLTHPAQVDVWRWRFLTFGEDIGLSHHTVTLLEHWWVMARNHPRLRGGPRRYLFPRWDDLQPLRPEEVRTRFHLAAFPRALPPHDESGAVFGLVSAGDAHRVHEDFPEARDGGRYDVFCRTTVDFEAVLRRLHGERVRHLSLHGQVGLPGLLRLARAEGAEHLRSLHLVLCDLGPEGAKVLARSPAFAELRELVLDGNPLGPEGLAALAEGPGLRQLRSLSLMGCQLGPEGVARLGRSALVRRLLVLDIGSNALGDGLRAWAEQDGPWSLEVLGLGQNFDSDGKGLAAWLRGPLASRLRWLDAEHCGLGDGLLEALADSPHLGRLAVLDVGRNHATASGVARLARATSLERLVWVGLAGNRFGSEGTAALARAPWLRRVTNLGLADTGADPEALLSSEHLGRLVSLDLRDNELPLELEARFLASPRLPRLERVALRTAEYE